jgi:inhibitor of cysteine peptidase
MRRLEVSQLTLTQADRGKSFEAHQDDVIIVRLPENPTTGYRWAIEEVDEEILEPEESDFSLSDFSLSPDAGIGGGGERKLSFRAKKAGIAHLELKLARSWEESAGIDRYGVTIHVR